MPVNERIRDARRRGGVTQSELGRMLGVSNSTISEWESGNRGVPINVVSEIAKALNVSVPWLMDWAEDADALAPANALSQGALHVARVYDSLDCYGQRLLTWIADHESARVAETKAQGGEKAAPGKDEFKIAQAAIDAISGAPAQEASAAEE